MNPQVHTLKTVDSVRNLLKALKTGHHAFPLLNSKGYLVGIIPSNFIIILLTSKSVYDP
jgi:CBS-domain-containing membrane protein